jgi:hypothetical protein
MHLRTQNRMSKRLQNEESASSDSDVALTEYDVTITVPNLDQKGRAQPTGPRRNGRAVGFCGLPPALVDRTERSFKT